MFALVAAVWLGLVFTQVVYFGHDAGHHQIFDGARGNRAVGLIAGNLLTRMSFGWWVPKHGGHHAHPNQIGRDRDRCPPRRPRHILQGVSGLRTPRRSIRGP